MSSDKIGTGSADSSVNYPPPRVDEAPVIPSQDYLPPQPGEVPVMPQQASKAPVKSGKPKKPFYKNWWIWVIAAWLLVCVVAIVIGSLTEGNSDSTDNNKAAVTHESTTTTVTPKKIAESDATESDATKVKSILAASSGQPAATVYKQLIGLGYNITFTHAVSKQDFTETVIDAINHPNAQTSNPWIVTDYSDLDVENKEVTLFVDTPENMDKSKAAEATKDALNKKLDLDEAWIAVDVYGQDKYPRGFKLSWNEILSEAPKNASTWSLKARCNVTDEFGATRKGVTCEAEVTGTTADPQVISFRVY